MKYVRIALGVLISAACLAWAFWAIVVDPHNRLQAKRALQEAHWGWLAPSLAVFWLAFFVRGLRWQVLLRPVQRVRLWDAYRAVMIGFGGNSLLPLRMGEILRAVAIGTQAGVSKSSALATIFVERAIDGVGISGMFAAVALTYPGPRRPITILAQEVSFHVVRFVGLLFGLGFLAALGAALLMTFRPEWFRTAQRFCCRPLPARFRQPLARVTDSFLSGTGILARPGLLVGAIGYTTVIWTLHVVMTLLFFRAFGFELPVAAGVFVLSSTGLFITIPGAPSHVGTFHAGTIFALLVFGVARGPAGSFAIVYHLVQVSLLAFVGLYHANALNVRLSAIRQTSPQAACDR